MIGLIFIFSAWSLVPVLGARSARPSTSSRSASSSRSRPSSSRCSPPSTSAQPSNRNTRKEREEHVDILLAQTTDAGLADLGKAIAFGVGVGLGAVGAGIGIGTIFGSMIQAVARQPELRARADRHPVARLRAHRGRRLLRAPRRPARLRPRLMKDALLQAFLFAQETTTTAEEDEGSLIDVVPGLMVWTILTFLIVLWVLRRFAFGRIQAMHRPAARPHPRGARRGRQGPRGGPRAPRARPQGARGGEGRARAHPRRVAPPGPGQLDQARAAADRT